MDELLKELQVFRDARDWMRFHTPDNLARSVAIEAGELLECFQWEPQCFDRERVVDELADVFTYCCFLALRLGVSPDQIIREKLQVTAVKYPEGTALNNR
ncbi:MAG: nucleotide pyrophosphohydrolase [Varibaculum sp.]|nr:nucleotide pyrophosphohydrolase [Varibaculum sp.]